MNTLQNNLKSNLINNPHHSVSDGQSTDQAVLTGHLPINIKKLAELSYIALTPEEETRFSKSLESIIEVLHELQSVDTYNVKPFSFAPIDVQNLEMNKDDSYKTQELTAWLNKQDYGRAGYIAVPHFQER